ncbi:metal-dependent hydrolase [Patescibacteria group bacterium]|nr:metal-dependent hydrolase [Patescibacteria group bacterium]
MFIDLIFGTIGFSIALFLGFGWDSVLIFFAALAIDGDILVNEFFRIFIKKEKRFSLSTLLDEYSYTHKYILHLPLIIVPLVFIVGLLYRDFLFGLLLTLMVLAHLVHDTMDNNFDGVSWLWPFSYRVYKLRRGSLEIKAREILKKEAEDKAKKPRKTLDILKDNKL